MNWIMQTTGAVIFFEPSTTYDKVAILYEYKSIEKA